MSERDLYIREIMTDEIMHQDLFILDEETNEKVAITIEGLKGMSFKNIYIDSYLTEEVLSANFSDHEIKEAKARGKLWTI